MKGGLRRAIVAAAWVVACAAGAAGRPAIAHATFVPAERIPTDSPVYRDLERLAETYGAAPQFLSIRPLRNSEAVAFLAGLEAAHPEAERDPAYRRALRELVNGALGASGPLIDKREQDQRFTASPYASFRYEDDPRNRPDVNRDYRAGVSVTATFDTSTVLVADLYEGTASQGGRGTPNFGTGDALIEGVDVNSYVNEAYVEFNAARVRVLAGHTWLRWGPGREGTLALSDAAPALDLARFELGMFRKWRFQWFVSLLDPGPQTYLAGHRLEWSPCPRVTAGFTELARFDGTSQAPLYLMPLVPYSFWEKRPRTAIPGGVPGDSTGELFAKNNVLWSADVSWIAKPGLRLWGEFMMDDFSVSKDYKPDMIGYQAGAEARRRIGGAARMLDASLEYTRVNNYTYSVWHHHDFADEGYPLGFVLGPDVASLVGELGYEHSAAWELRIRGEWRKKGEGRLGDFYDKQAGGTVDAATFEGVVERETRVSGSLIYTPARWLRLEATVGASAIKNRGHVVGGGADGETPITLSGKVTW